MANTILRGIKGGGAQTHSKTYRLHRSEGTWTGQRRTPNTTVWPDEYTGGAPEVPLTSPEEEMLPGRTATPCPHSLLAGPTLPRPAPALWSSDFRVSGCPRQKAPPTSLRSSVTPQGVRLPGHWNRAYQCPKYPGGSAPTQFPNLRSGTPLQCAQASHSGRPRFKVIPSVRKKTEWGEGSWVAESGEPGWMRGSGWFREEQEKRELRTTS